MIAPPEAQFVRFVRRNNQYHFLLTKGGRRHNRGALKESQIVNTQPAFCLFQAHADRFNNGSERGQQPNNISIKCFASKLALATNVTAAVTSITSIPFCNKFDTSRHAATICQHVFTKHESHMSHPFGCQQATAATTYVNIRAKMTQ